MKKTNEPDPTGLVLVGRNERDGRYVYESLSVLHETNRVALTQAQRVGLAVCYRLVRRVWGAYAVYPMTRQSATLGWGSYGRKRLWLQRPQLERIGRAFLDRVEPIEAWRAKLFDVLAHEVGHNLQPHKLAGWAFSTRHREELDWVYKHAHRVRDKLRLVDDYETLSEVARLVGYEPRGAE